MSEMLDRIAEALVETKSIGPAPRHYAMARKVLKAMREPTEAMVAAGIEQVKVCTDDWSTRAACVPEHTWPAMIDAALTEHSRPARRPR